jgi:hypothetical protein
MSKKIYMQQPYMTKLKGRDYMIVAGRLLWFRDEHPDGAIITNPVVAGNNVVAIKCEIIVDDRILASGMATVRGGKGTSWDGREIEKAETAAIGRALAHAGFGTQFALADIDEADYLADSPVNQPTRSKPAGNTSAKVAIWNALRNDAQIKSAYTDEAVLRDRVGFYPEDVVTSGFNAVKSWLLANANAEAEAIAENS